MIVKNAILFHSAALQPSCPQPFNIASSAPEAASIAMFSLVQAWLYNPCLLLIVFWQGRGVSSRERLDPPPLIPFKEVWACVF